MIAEANLISWTIAAKENKNFFSARAQAKLLLQGSRAVKDPLVNDHIENIFSSNTLTKGLRSSTVLQDFKNEFLNWLHNHSTNSVIGLENYVPSFSAGTTQAFDSFYYRHRHKRMTCFVGEYFYHLKTWISNNVHWSFVNNLHDLSTGDALVISVPFCDTGNMVNNLNEILLHCESHDIPVLIDCCYYPISSGVNLNLNYSSIDSVAFSLSKAFPIANLRIGVRYTRPNIDDGQTLHDSINYNNTLSSYVGLKIIERFGSDYIFNTYQQRQQQLCSRFGIEPSQSVLFAIGNKSWNMYNRSNLLNAYKLDFDPALFNNRISLVSIFDNWDIFNEVTT